MIESKKIKNIMVREKELNPDVLAPRANNKLFPRDLKKDFANKSFYYKDNIILNDALICYYNYVMGIYVEKYKLYLSF